MGNFIAHTQFNRLTITNAFDAQNRLVSRKRADDGTELEHYTYTATGQRETRSDASGEHFWIYNERDALWLYGTPVGLLVYAYDENGNVTRIQTSTSGTDLGYDYDALNRLTNVTVAGAAAAGYNYDAMGNLETVQYGNGVRHVYQYDRLNRLTRLVVTNVTAGMLLGQFSYELDALGARTRLAETIHHQPAPLERTCIWRYDALSRLTNEMISGLGQLHYAYDAAGNRLERRGSMDPREILRPVRLERPIG